MIQMIRISDGAIIATSEDKQPRRVVAAAGSGRDKSIITPGKANYLRRKKVKALLQGRSVACWIIACRQAGRSKEEIVSGAYTIDTVLGEEVEAWLLQEKDL